MNRDIMSAQVFKKLILKGVVQGVGFRPFVYRTAVENQISGSVINFGNSVEIIAAGTPEQMTAFISALTEKNPPLSRIDDIDIQTLSDENLPIRNGFFISDSVDGAGSGAGSIIPPDTAVCSDCLSDMSFPENRRYLYPFTVCTNCGPRYTTVKKLPYDRKNTVMDEFPLCDDCAAEYADVQNRRYHAQPVCCPNCGPVHTFEKMASDGDCPISFERNTVLLSRGNNALKDAAKTVDDGFILAFKGDGGFHLVCDAFNEEAVRLLRSRLNRPSQPFAVMTRDVAAARKQAQIRAEDGKELSLLENRRRPIVLCNKSEAYALAPSVAPRLHNLGMMLPYSAAHSVFFHSLKTDVVVMTSANLPGLPMVIDNDDAFLKLSSVADYFLFHNRQIQNRTDDTVIRFVYGRPIFLRRSRGFVPERIVLPFSHPSGIAGAGAEMNNTVSFAEAGHVYLSQYIGNTKHLQTVAYHADVFQTLQRLTGICPQVIACDRHPSFNTTKFAEEYAVCKSAELIRVQHHHAHICSVMADNDLPLDATVIGVALDGVGYGDDQTIWGGEILECTYSSYERSASLAPQPMAGGDSATRYPARLVFGMLFSYIADGKLKEEDLLALNLYFPRGKEEARLVLSQLRNHFNIASSSSSGRVLDAAAALLGLCNERTYDGEPAMILESAAYSGLFENPDLNYFKCEIRSMPNAKDVLDTSALMYALFCEVQKTDSAFSKNELAVMFVHAFAEGIAQLVLKTSDKTGILTVCLSGGVANNDYIVSVLATRLKENGIDLLMHKNLPPGDGCISHGQVASATAQLIHRDKNKLRE